MLLGLFLMPRASYSCTHDNVPVDNHCSSTTKSADAETNDCCDACSSKSAHEKCSSSSCRCAVFMPFSFLTIPMVTTDFTAVTPFEKYQIAFEKAYVNSIHTSIWQPPQK